MLLGLLAILLVNAPFDLALGAEAGTAAAAPPFAVLYRLQGGNLAD